jgi:ornithine cyclodeaminase/alanine dehydrogenase-like protein (mu-crystallin family)
VNEAGDFLIPKSEGVITDAHIRAELGELLVGSHKARESDDEITLFKSLGLAVEDVAAAHHIYARAVERGVGTSVEMGGKRSAH